MKKELPTNKKIEADEFVMLLRFVNKIKELDIQLYTKKSVCLFSPRQRYQSDRNYEYYYNHEYWIERMFRKECEMITSKTVSPSV